MMRLAIVQTPHLSERAIPKHALQPGRRMQDLPSDLLRLAKIFGNLLSPSFSSPFLLLNEDKRVGK